MKYFLSSVLLMLHFSIFAQADFHVQLSNAALSIINPDILYDPDYFSMDYPNGDVPSDRGVCTDVLIRAYRVLGIDLQKEVHEDIEANFAIYPDNWDLIAPDKNIDHRRVPNLMTFFRRKGVEKSITQYASDYQRGDIVCWDLGGGITHIGIIVDKKSKDGKRHLVVHNIGQGQVMADCLFAFRIIGHYRYPID